MSISISSSIVQWIDRSRYLLLARNARRPRGIDEMDKLRSEGYFSQNGQDKWLVEEIFSGKRGGVFVDIGAHDGVSISNTYYLEKELAWMGVAVEPIPSVYDRLVHNRSCRTVNACVGTRDGIATFRVIEGYSEQLSGVVENYHPEHLKRIEKEVAEHGGVVSDREVACYSINTLLQVHGLYDIDYLNIDVEGSELSIINTLDFDRFNIKVIGIENNYADYRLPQLLTQKGFKFHSIVGDEFYVRL